MKKLLTTSLFFGGGAALLLLPLVVFGQEAVDQFVPLTGLPALDGIRSTEGLAEFLNAVYKLCIGVAASLAIVQLIRAGWMIMINTGSFMHNEKARSIIRDSVFGLILVLSPAIVFGIIDPRILDLNLDFSPLQVGEVGPGTYERGLTNEEIADISDFMVTNAFSACNVPVTDAQQACAREKILNDSLAQIGECFPGLSSEQLSCIGSRMSGYAATARQCEAQGGEPVIHNGNTIRCVQPSEGECPVYDAGLTTIDVSQEACCRAQENCEFQALPRSQYRCNCTAPADGG